MIKVGGFLEECYFCYVYLWKNFWLRDTTTTQTNINPPPPILFNINNHTTFILFNILIDNHTQQKLFTCYSHSFKVRNHGSYRGFIHCFSIGYFRLIHIIFNPIHIKTKQNPYNTEHTIHKQYNIIHTLQSFTQYIHTSTTLLHSSYNTLQHYIYTLLLTSSYNL